MKIEEKQNKLIIYLNKNNNLKIDLNNKINLEKKFQELFSKIKKIYAIDMSGSFEITIYNNEYYGNIIEIEKEELEYFEYYDTIDMKITLSKYNEILYKMENIEKNISKKSKIYTYNGEIYLKPLKNQLIGLLEENGEIIYGKKSYDILKKAKEVHKVDKKIQNMYN